MAKNNKVQRALVLQGEASLGVYEAAVFNVLYYWIRKENYATGEKDNVFEVINGTSLGGQ